MAKTKKATHQALTVQRRDAMGRQRVKTLGPQGLVPGVVYGRSVKPIPLAINRRELVRLLHATTGEHALVTLRLEGDKVWEQAALVHEVQHDPVDGRIIHVDFHAIALTERIKVKVAVVLKGEPVGVKQEGGILEHFLREVEVECLPTEIPPHLEFDIAPLKVGEAVHVRDLVPPANTKITSAPEGVIASVQEPKVEQPEEAAAAVTEPEVLREKKEEPEAAGEPAKGESAPAKKDAKV